MPGEQPLRVQLIGKPGSIMTGTARYTQELSHGLAQSGLQVTMTSPELPRWMERPADWLKQHGPDVRAFLGSYPIAAPRASVDLYHITSQTLATLLIFQRFPAPVVVTVLDIIPWLVKDHAELNVLRHPADRGLYRLALAGLQRADHLIAISHYTKQTLIDYLNIPADKIQVTYLGVDQQHFHPQTVPAAFQTRYGLRPDERYVLYIGSEDPRKNLTTLIHGFARLQAMLSENHSMSQSRIKLIKAGKPHFSPEPLRTLIAELGLQANVLLLDDVPEEDLPLLYNVADLVVLPSLYEGFGFPVIEALACDTPVLVAQSSSLSELVSDPAYRFDPGDPAALAATMYRLLQQPPQPERWRAQAAHFTWEQTVQTTLNVYRKCSVCAV